MAAGVGLRVDQVTEIEEPTASDALRNSYCLVTYPSGGGLWTDSGHWQHQEGQKWSKGQTLKSQAANIRSGSLLQAS
jgi:hypothetical protein